MIKMICIVCPRGCHLEVDENLNVTGHACKRGEVYALNEIKNPTRMITSTVKVIGGEITRLPVVTSAPIPKGKIFAVMDELDKVIVQAPIALHDIIIKNILHLNVDIIATRPIEKKEVEVL